MTLSLSESMPFRFRRKLKPPEKRLSLPAVGCIPKTRAARPGASPPENKPTGKGSVRNEEREISDRVRAANAGLFRYRSQSFPALDYVSLTRVSVTCH